MGEKIWIPGDPVPTGRGESRLTAADLRDVMVHVLHAGVPLCGFSRLVPRDWPSGHLFVVLAKAGASTCSKCQRLAEELVAERRAEKQNRSEGDGIQQR